MGFRRGQGFLFPSAGRPHFQLIRFFGEAFTSQVFCSRFLQAFGSPVLNLRLFGSNRAVAAIPKMSLSPSRTLKHMGTFPSFRTILQSSLQNLCRFRITNWKFSSFCSASSSQFNLSSIGSLQLLFWHLFGHIVVP